jgi:superfamily II DNA or RNA helicase
VPGFLGVERLSLGPWQAFERALQRLLVHAGLNDVRLVGGSGDEGGDIVGDLHGSTWVVQAKHRSTGQIVGTEPIDEVTVAVDRYGATVAAVATNTGYSAAAVTLARKRAADMGVKLYLWNGDFLLEWVRKLPAYPEHQSDARDYQQGAIDAIRTRILGGAPNALLLMATGLGKTRVASAVIESWISDHPGDQVLLLAPTLALIPQLESALWPFIARAIPTHVLTGSEKPSFEGGVTVATFQSAQTRSRDLVGRFGLIVVDEAHHAPADGTRQLLADLEAGFLLGMTATPWRSDERALEEIFGAPTYTVSIVDGMQLGYLAEVDYRMLLDNIDWEWVRKELRGRVSIRELNRRLFLPERDEAVVAKITVHLQSLAAPRCIVFCRSIEHATSVSQLLKADGIANRLMHSRLDRFEATEALREFRRGAVPVIVTVDMLNEGIDVPEVNMIVFLRVTHSRRIFVQQLGRGLRLDPSKKSVLVLDFVSDIRRVAEGLRMNSEGLAVSERDPLAVVRYPLGHIVNFQGDKSADFFEEYLADAASLADGSDESVLGFPD